MAQRSEHEMEALLRDALQPEVLDEQQLIRKNNLLKIQLVKKEQTREVSLCYLPGIFHAVVLFLLAAAICLLVKMPLVQGAVILFAIIGSAAGGVLTRVGIRYFDLKKRMTVQIPTLR